jgi:hypothetical protein
MANKFKVGEKVKVLGNEHTRIKSGPHEFEIGQHVYVERAAEENIYNCLDENGETWWVHENDLEFIDGADFSLIPLSLIEEGYNSARTEGLKLLIKNHFNYEFGVKEYRYKHDVIQRFVEHREVCVTWKEKLREYLPKPVKTKLYRNGTLVRVKDNSFFHTDEVYAIAQVASEQFMLICSSEFNRYTDEVYSGKTGLSIADIARALKCHEEQIEIVKEVLVP